MTRLIFGIALGVAVLLVSSCFGVHLNNLNASSIRVNNVLANNNKGAVRRMSDKYEARFSDLEEDNRKLRERLEQLEDRVLKGGDSSD